MDAAEALFLKHGFRRVAIEEICRKASVSRKTYYVYFDNKEALIIQLLDKIIDTLSREFVEIMNGAVSFTEKMVQFMELKLAFSRRLSMEFFTDLSSWDVVMNHYRKKADENFAIARSLFMQAQAKGDIRSELDVEFILEMLNFQMELWERPEFRARFTDGASLMKQMTEMLLFGIVGSNKAVK
jgi:AcrR family transcriptional regulator